MTDVQHVEAAVRERDRVSRRPLALQRIAKRAFIENRRVHSGSASSRSIARRNSSFDTVAVPIFMTTIPPA